MSETEGFGSLSPEIVVHHVVPFLDGAAIAVLAKVNRTLRAHLWRLRLLHLWPLYMKKYLIDLAFRAELTLFLPVDRLYLVVPGVEGDTLSRTCTDLSAFARVHTADLCGLPDMSYGPSINTMDLSPLEGVHTVRMCLNPQVTRGIDLTPLARAHTLSIYTKANGVDFSPVANVPCLELASASGNLSDFVPLRGRHMTVMIEDVVQPDLLPIVSARKVTIPLCKSIRDFSPLSLVHTVSLGECDAQALPDALGSVHTLVLTGWWMLKNVSTVRSIHTLIAAQSCLTDIAPLSGVHTLQCSVTNTDLSPLQTAHSLTLGAEFNVRGLASLGRVHKLSYRGRTANKSDFLQLGGVRHLSILFSDELADVSGLGRVHSLHIDQCHHVTDVLALGGIHSVKISSSSLRDVAALGRVHTLDLSNCAMVEDVSGLGGVHTLNLEKCKLVKDVSQLGGIYSLNLASTAVTDVSALGLVRILDLSFCPVEDVSALGSVHELNLRHCDNVTDCSALGRVHRLNLSNTSVEDVSALAGVHTLYLTSSFVKDVSSLGHVCVLDIRNTGVYDYTALANVRQLSRW